MASYPEHIRAAHREPLTLNAAFLLLVALVLVVVGAIAVVRDARSSHRDHFANPARINDFGSAR
jgi:hypothetical protein